MQRKRETFEVIFYVYIYRDCMGVPIYVGKRSGRHRHPSSTHNPGIHEAIKIYQVLGYDPKPEIVYRSPNEAAMLRREAQLIAEFGRRDQGTGTLFNATDASEAMFPVNNCTQLRDDPKFVASCLEALERNQERRSVQNCYVMHRGVVVRHELTASSMGTLNSLHGKSCSEPMAVWPGRNNGRCRTSMFDLTFS
jgi:hypothetical protein